MENGGLLEAPFAQATLNPDSGYDFTRKVKRLDDTRVIEKQGFSPQYRIDSRNYLERSINSTR